MLPPAGTSITELESAKLNIEERKLEMERLKVRVDAWKKTVDVQQHFNDLELRIRSYAVTVLTAVLSVTGFAIKEKLFVTLETWRTPLAAWFLGVGVVAWGAFYFMDRWWYHRLLKGAVLHGTAVENKIAEELKDQDTVNLGAAISKASPFQILGWEVHSSRKIDLFYGSVALILVILAVVLHVTL